MTNSFRKMTNDRVIKRRDGEQIRVEDIHIDPTFNPPGRNDEQDSHDDELYEHICASGSIPELEVYPREEDGVWIVEGHRRFKQLLRAIAAGRVPADPKDGFYWVKVKQFIGNDIKRAARVITSNKRKGLTPLQEAHQMGVLAGFGLSAADIAKEVHCSEKHVADMLALNNSNHDVQNAVKAGDIAFSTAIDVVKDHGALAGAVIEAEVKKAKAQGKKRATAGTIRGWRPTPRLTTPMITAAERLVDSIHLADRMRIESGCTDDNTMISVPASALAALLKPHEDIVKARQEAAQRIRERTFEAAQGDIVKEAA